MRRLSWLFVLPGAGLLAQAPESIGGKVYRESEATPFLRSASETTLLFHREGRFTHLKAARVSFLAQPFGGRVLIEAPRSDGTYTYQRTSATMGVMELRHDDGTTTRMERTFTAGAGGFAGIEANPNLTFTLGELEAVQSAPASNVSLRGRVAPGAAVHVGFVVPGVRGPNTGHRITQPDATTRDVLIRVVGPSLAQFGVTSAWADPEFRLYQGATEVVPWQWIYQDWSTVPAGLGGGVVANAGGMAGLRKIFSYVGAFPLSDDSKDAVGVVRLAPGAYTIVAEPPAGAAGGEVLVEIYFLP